MIPGTPSGVADAERLAQFRRRTAGRRSATAPELLRESREGRAGDFTGSRRLKVTLVVDASVALNWVLEAPDNHLAQTLAEGEEELLVPDFWLNEATNICWLQ